MMVFDFLGCQVVFLVFYSLLGTRQILIRPIAPTRKYGTCMHMCSLNKRSDFQENFLKLQL